MESRFSRKKGYVLLNNFLLHSWEWRQRSNNVELFADMAQSYQNIEYIVTQNLTS